MDFPKVSIFLTTYNWPAALKICIESIFTQTIKPNEIIIADDGSKEETKELVTELKKISPIPIIHVWQADEGYRINHIRNLAIKNASYPYIIQIDGDIILHKDFVVDHLTFAQKGRFVVGRRTDINEHHTSELLQNGDIKALPNLFRNKLIAILHRYLLGNKKSVKGVRGCNIAFWKTDAIAINGYDEEMTSKGPNDKEFAARLVNLGVNAYDLKFYACCYHLYHGEEGMRTNYSMVKNILDDTISTRKVRCDSGINNITE